MAAFGRYLVVLATIIVKTECQPASFFQGAYSPDPYSGNFLQSFASQIPAAQVNSVTGSRFPPPQPPQVLLDALKIVPPQAAAPAPNPLQSSRNMFGGAGINNRSSSAQLQSSSVNTIPLPITANMKAMVTQWATQMGHKSYYEAHGCVDPSTLLHGQQGQMASMAQMFGCNSYAASQACEMAQLVHAGGQGSHMRTMMSLMMDKTMKRTLEECLTPSTVMNGFMGSMMSPQQTGLNQVGYAPPPQASGSKGGAVDCSGIAQMLMMSTAAEGMMTPEALEQIGVMRNRYFKMSCQENMILGSLPYRICCPGYVKPPTTQEAMMLRGMTGA